MPKRLLSNGEALTSFSSRGRGGATVYQQLGNGDFFPAALKQGPAGESPFPRPAPAVAWNFKKGSPTTLIIYIPSDLELLNQPEAQSFLEAKATLGHLGQVRL